MELSASTVGALVVIAIVVGAAALAVAVAALQGQKRVRDAYRKFSLGSDDDVLTMLQRHVDEVRALRREIGGQREYADSLRSLIGNGLSRVATVRYDAFDDMGGRMSFSTALLDEHGDGVVLTSINGRVETRTYAKPVGGGDSEHNLSGEERQAIDRAREHRPRAAQARPPKPTPAYEGVPVRTESEDDAPQPAPGPAAADPLDDDADADGDAAVPVHELDEPGPRRPHPYDELTRMDDEDGPDRTPSPGGATRADDVDTDQDEGPPPEPPTPPNADPSARPPRTARPRPSTRRPTGPGGGS